MNDGNSTASSTIQARFVNVKVSRGRGLIEREIVHGFVPSFNETEKIQC